MTKGFPIESVSDGKSKDSRKKQKTKLEKVFKKRYIKQKDSDFTKEKK